MTPQQKLLEYWELSQHYQALTNETERAKFIQYVVIPASYNNDKLSRLVDRHNKPKAA